MGLHLTEMGKQMMKEAEKTAVQLELKSTARLSEDERKTLMKLLKKIYK
jgi:DNA-binding MarR family transcriptional regulator